MRHVLAALVGTAALSIACAPCALAADLTPPPVYTKAPTVVPPTYNWTGFYLGGDAGGAWTSNTAMWSPLPSPAAFGIAPGSGTDGGSGFIGGIYAGYNWQFTSTLLVGLEGDWSWSRAGGSFTQQPWLTVGGGPAAAASFTHMTSTLDWISSLRARAGYLVAPNLLAYVTGGAAWAKIDYAANNFNGGLYSTSTTNSDTQTGFTVGGGLEWSMTKNWLLRAEYLYYHFNNGPKVVANSIAFPAFPSNYIWGSINVSVARAGLAYKF
jgi:outer membrane immunogenic protein